MQTAFTVQLRVVLSSRPWWFSGDPCARSNCVLPFALVFTAHSLFGLCASGFNFSAECCFAVDKRDHKTASLSAPRCCRRQYLTVTCCWAHDDRVVRSFDGEGNRARRHGFANKNSSLVHGARKRYNFPFPFFCCYCSPLFHSLSTPSWRLWGRRRTADGRTSYLCCQSKWLLNINVATMNDTRCCRQMDGSMCVLSISPSVRTHTNIRITHCSVLVMYLHMRMHRNLASKRKPDWRLNRYKSRRMSTPLCRFKSVDSYDEEEKVPNSAEREWELFIIVATTFRPIAPPPTMTIFICALKVNACSLFDGRRSCEKLTAKTWNGKNELQKRREKRYDMK